MKFLRQPVLVYFKELILFLIRKLGYRLHREIHHRPIDVRSLGNDPRSLFYYTEVNRQVLVQAPISSGRGLEVFSLDKNGCHPFVRAVGQALNSECPLEMIQETLTSYYELVQPGSSAEWLGLIDGDSALAREPAWVSLLPWERASIEQKRAAKQKCAASDNKEHGNKVPIESGWRNFGPVEKDVLDIESKRLYALLLSVRKNGLLRNDDEGGDIGAVVLMREGQWRWLVEWGGQHRAAVLSAMNYESIPIRVWQVVDREDVDIWPSVKSGVYSKGAALHVFDMIFDGTPPEVLRAWVQRNERNTRESV